MIRTNDYTPSGYCQDCGTPNVDYVDYGGQSVEMPVPCDCAGEANRFEIYEATVNLPIVDSDPDDTPIYLFIAEDDTTDFIPAADWANEPSAVELVDSLKYFFPKVESEKTLETIEAALSKISGSALELESVSYYQATKAIN